MKENLIDQGVSLMTYGMGTVFVFLTLLVFATLLMSTIIRRLTPKDPTGTDTPRPTTSSHASLDPKVRAAIQQAIQLYRKQRGSK